MYFTCIRQQQLANVVVIYTYLHEGKEVLPVVSIHEPIVEYPVHLVHPESVHFGGGVGALTPQQKHALQEKGRQVL